MMTMEKMSAAGNSDAELVTGSLAGQRDGFRQIVERYQSLICSLAYSATGSLSQSEDLAQETFVAAWKQLAELREPSKLRSWLCGIARNRIGKALRRDGCEPVHGAEPLETAHESPATEPLAPAQAISREEEAILWRSLERIPDLYREPVVLFYRDHQSIERVAEELELSEDAVKQRLSRGRKLLHEQVLAFVEGALERTNPGKAFTLGVLASLPVFATSASAVTIGATAAKGSATAKAAGLMGAFNAIFGPALIAMNMYLGYKLDRDSARSPQRRALVIKCWRALLFCMAAFLLASVPLAAWGRPLAKSDPRLLVGLVIGLEMAFLTATAILVFWQRRCRHRIVQQEISGNLSPAGKTCGLAPVPVFEYRSNSSLLGWPLIHIRIRGGLERGPVKAWIAAGDAAIGIIFAFGALAIAPLSLGGLSVGVLTLGGFAVGLLPLGGSSFGLWAFGTFAVGWLAFGGCAIGWTAAEGGLAVARDFALGGVALASHANDAAAEVFIRNNVFFRNATTAMEYMQWLTLLGLIPLGIWWLARRQKRHKSM